ncbi:hypothetical protein LRS06_11350 [Hymenobacter sp. J193]|uniref:hypothetical protein n=1 Tax=Hymenobacter sp. J193 TaxID=2898429 RepID=UPI002150EE06|nr:hypothetical protein [Hymenobacter sp. J193]MCR5888348.1 hypothetical protein [Hymenobacter sp. J193]
MKIIRFRQLKRAIRFTKSEEDFIALIPKNYNDAWDGSLADLKKNGTLKRGAVGIRDNIKSAIKKRLKTIQGNNCIYCGLHFKIVGTSQREHIADKANYPEFVFERYNIALACSYCNGFDKKGVINTINKHDYDYSKCEFNIIHPYFDNIDDHIDFLFTNTKVVIKPKIDSITKAQSIKAVNTISMFELAGSVQSLLRGSLYKAKKINSTLSNSAQRRAELITSGNHIS